MIYDVNYFIEKFEAIPEENWCIGAQINRNEQRCAIGHCFPSWATFKDYITCVVISAQDTEEGKALILLFSPLSTRYDKEGDPALINNGMHPRYQQSTPKQRILAALYDLKKMQEPVKERIVYVAVPATITEQAKELINN